MKKVCVCVCVNHHRHRALVILSEAAGLWSLPAPVTAAQEQ